MEDEFLAYMKNKIDDRLIMSFDNTDLLLWGTRENSSVKLLGLTLNVGVRDLRTIKSKLDEDRVSNAVKAASLLSRSSNSTFFVILYSLSGGSSFRVTDPRDPQNWLKIFEVQETKMPELIEGFFKTSLMQMGRTRKSFSKIDLSRNLRQNLRKQQYKSMKR